MIRHLKASPRHRYNYPILDYTVTDGDSIKVLIDLGFDASLKMTCRLNGIDMPEDNTHAGKLVALVVKAWMESQSSLTVDSVKKDKYAGRFLGIIYGPIVTASQSLQAYLIKEGLGRVYHGDARLPWSEEELNLVESKASKLLEKLA